MNEEINPDKKGMWIAKPMRYKSFRVTTSPHLLLPLAFFSYTYLWYDAVKTERKNIEERVLTAFDTNKNGIISREGRGGDRARSGGYGGARRSEGRQPMRQRRY